MGALAIVLWIAALAGGAVFPPLFIAPIYASYLWWQQSKRIKAARVLAAKRAKAPKPIDPDALLKLARLRDSGVITGTEFDAQKALIMGEQELADKKIPKRHK